MNLPEEAPKLPTFPFIAGDLVLIAAAIVIATRSPAPISPGALLAITICVVFGAALLVVPFLANYARRQDALLNERQNQIAALARTTAESAEQLSIAAAGLHGISESTRHNLDAITKLPAQIQERIDDVTQQLAGSAIASQDPVNEHLVQLEAAVEKISRSLARLDTAAKARSDALAVVEKDLAASLARAATQIDAFVANAITHAVRTTEAHDEPKPKSSKSKGKAAPAGTPAQPSEAAIPNEASGASTPPVEPPAAAFPVADQPAPDSTPVAVEQAVPAAPTPLPEPLPAVDPAPAESEPAFAPAEPDATEVPVNEPEPPKPPRARKNKASDDSSFDLGLTSDAQGATETAVTSDGFTRLIATAYIGIGNKLYIRGDGPGLSWDKGVALQFVSIGKWRWETPDATQPITAKLYKNDQVECPGLGALTIEPGRQHEVNAGF
jgi:hypothetical protein